MNHDILHQIEHNPDLGAKITVTSLFISIFIRIIENDHVHPIIMDLAQLAAWLIGAFVGCLTAISYIKRLFFEKKTNK